jgi:membrane associated rhomboid family serine protease
MVTTALLVVNAVFFVATLTQEGGAGRIVEGTLQAQGALRAAEVADGEVWRLVTSAFLHGGLLHIAFNMVLLWWLGTALERYAGSLRMAIVYFSAVLWASAGALYLDPDVYTLGASGGVFGLMGAVLWIEWRERYALMGGSIWALVALNLVITFVLPGISVGGHLGGFAGGVLAAVALSGLGRYSLARAQFDRGPLLLGLGVLVAGGVAALAAAHLA